MIELKDFGIGFGDRMLLKDVDARFNAATLTALIGRNGTGKSTLLRAVAGLNHNYSGTVLIGGTDISTAAPLKLSRLMAMVSTRRPRIPNMTCRAAVETGRAPYTGWTGSLSAADRAIVDEAMEATSTAGFADRPLDSLSDGECQRVMIARAVAQDTPVILLDEPTSFLDLPGRYELCDLLAGLAHAGHKTIVFSTHELDIALDRADSIALIDPPGLLTMTPGEIVASGAVERLFNIKMTTR